MHTSTKACGSSMERPSVTDFDIVHGVLSAVFRYSRLPPSRFNIGTFGAVNRAARDAAIFWIENLSLKPPAPSPAVEGGGGD